jgi:hypothetical protein
MQYRQINIWLTLVLNHMFLVGTFVILGVMYDIF